MPILEQSFPDLKDRSIFITGGGKGIGASITQAFLEQGAKVAFVQRSDAAAFVDQMDEETGNRPLFQPCDLTDVGALKAAIRSAEEQHGPITVLVSNAANDTRHGIEEMTVEDWDANQAVNLRPYFFAAQAVVPSMRAAGGGSIINFSSISYMMGNGGYPAYVTANAGITGMTRGLARDLGKDRIRVNALMPGWVMTERQKELWVTEEALAGHLARQCLPDPLDPKDIAGGVLFLASSLSSSMTAQALVIDGGVVVSGC